MVALLVGGIGALIFLSHVKSIQSLYLLLMTCIPPLMLSGLVFQIDPSKSIVLICLVTLASLFLGSLCMLHPLGFGVVVFVWIVALGQQNHRLYQYIGEQKID